MRVIAVYTLKRADKTEHTHFLHLDEGRLMLWQRLEQERGKNSRNEIRLKISRLD